MNDGYIIGFSMVPDVVVGIVIAEGENKTLVRWSNILIEIGKCL